MIRVPPPSGNHRQQLFCDAATQTCLILKVLPGLPWRHSTSFVVSLPRMARLDWQVPGFSTLCSRQRTLKVSPPYYGGNRP
ncbi:transposase [Leisingera sp. M658]|uniref:transposase n=1 Tax=Leisingera sp. M658 TaxID=2867015 RepID=UPI00220C81B7|nr:transposase [Leisingera sp. M658]